MNAHEAAQVARAINRNSEYIAGIELYEGATARAQGMEGQWLVEVRDGQSGDVYLVLNDDHIRATLLLRSVEDAVKLEALVFPGIEEESE